MQHIFVDADNMCTNFNVKLAKERIQTVKNLGGHVHWHGNGYTVNFVKKEKLGIRIKESKNETNSADHDLVANLRQLRNTLVITRDQTLMKLALYFGRNVSFAKFVGTRLVPIKVNFTFRTRQDLEKFITSLNLYKTRFY